MAVEANKLWPHLGCARCMVYTVVFLQLTGAKYATLLHCFEDNDHAERPRKGIYCVDMATLSSRFFKRHQQDGMQWVIPDSAPSPRSCNLCTLLSTFSLPPALYHLTNIIIASPTRLDAVKQATNDRRRSKRFWSLSAGPTTSSSQHAPHRMDIPDPVSYLTNTDFFFSDVLANLPNTAKPWPSDYTSVDVMEAMRNSCGRKRQTIKQIDTRVCAKMSLHATCPTFIQSRDNVALIVLCASRSLVWRWQMHARHAEVRRRRRRCADVPVHQVRAVTAATRICAWVFDVVEQVMGIVMVVMMGSWECV
jgi:hypothetical protein